MKVDERYVVVDRWIWSKASGAVDDVSMLGTTGRESDVVIYPPTSASYD